MIALTASSLLTPLERIDNPVVLVEDGTIGRVGPREAVTIPAGVRVLEFGDAVLAPGLVDIHIHGGAGHDIMEPEAEALPCVERLLFRHGITSYLPTTITAPVDATLSALERLADVIDRAGDQHDRARPAGIHLEGPFLSHARRGVHPAENLLEPTVAMFNRFWEAARGHVKMITIAPEVNGALEVIREAAKRGVLVSLGHSDAGFDIAKAGVDAGARHATHTFNAMRPMSHRNPGILERVLSDDRISADIIVDGFHVDPSVVKVFMRAKTAERAVLITDALAATGMPEGKYRLGAMEFEVKDGKCTSGGTIAGSVLTMDQAVRNVMKFTGIDFQQALRTATMNPARAAGLPGQRGRLDAGAAADLVVFNRRQEVVRTIVAGRGI
jgi:N-acetylglucosamine-6-phosphate deacetylase